MASGCYPTVYPNTQIQTCSVHLFRNSLAFANWKERKSLASALKPIYQAANPFALLFEERFTNAMK
ncbi:transposase [Candidatus Glomeribacter gigasporarum]|uniref:transposase n=1 Tax=Candidatus Glomeribacter gigasporarum TaxID=132144 RepID=UPI003B968B4A